MPLKLENKVLSWVKCMTPKSKHTILKVLFKKYYPTVTEKKKMSLTQANNSFLKAAWDT